MRALTYDIKKTKSISSHYLYYVWLSFVRRCHNEKDKQYANYGGRGITVCDEWRNDSGAFFVWAIKNGYQKGLTLDRKDNDMGYSPENCRFISRYGQQRNRRNSHPVVYNGEARPLKEWAAYLDLDYSLIYSRLQRGIPPERAFKKYVTKNKLMDKELSKQLGASVKKILKDEGRTQRWLCGKMQEGGLKITEPSLSNKIAGEVETFTSEETDLIFSILGQDIRLSG